MPQHNFWFFMEVIWARSQPSIWFYTEKARKEKKVKGSLSDHSIWNWEDKEQNWEWSAIVVTKEKSLIVRDIPEYE